MLLFGQLVAAHPVISVQTQSLCPCCPLVNDVAVASLHMQANNPRGFTAVVAPRSPLQHNEALLLALGSNVAVHILTSAQGILRLASRNCVLLRVTHSREKKLLLFWDANFFFFFYFNQKVAFF